MADQNAPPAAAARRITTCPPRFLDFGTCLDTRSVVSSALVCKDWWKVIQNHPKWWKIVIRRIRINKALIHPDFRGIMESVEAKKEIKDLVMVLRQFSEKKKRIGTIIGFNDICPEIVKI